MRTVLLSALLLCACDAASTAVVDNAFADTFTVWRAWWQTTYFPAPVAPSSSSEALDLLELLRAVGAPTEVRCDSRAPGAVARSQNVREQLVLNVIHGPTSYRA